MRIYIKINNNFLKSGISYFLNERRIHKSNMSIFVWDKEVFFERFSKLSSLIWLLFVKSKQYVEDKVRVVVSKYYILPRIFCVGINKPCSDSCNNMSLRSVFFNIYWTDRSTYGRRFPNWWSVISINYIKLDINISIKLRCASVGGTHSDSISLTLYFYM